MFCRISCIFIFITTLLCQAPLLAQPPSWTLDPFGKEKKPEEYQEKKLGSEKTADKKFTELRHFAHNTITRYNYYFNATNKINGVLERAGLSVQEDYTKLLPFYPYSLDMTQADSVELDSVIYKATAGILLHDLRNDWIDNLYLLIGKAYYFRKEFDSAALTFQFINYNLFPRKKGEEDGRLIGSNGVAARGGMMSIADREDRTFIQKLFTLPPSRNDALIWLARTFVEAEDYGEASGIINILYADPNLPQRLRAGLNEVNAYWFYKQGYYDSCAVYLEKALPNAPTKDDRARWEFLLGQLYDLTGNYGKSSEFYLKSAKSTAVPLMDIYARLNDARLATDNLENNISKLLKMARKDKFEAYRDIIYYAAGQLVMQISDTTKAEQLYKKSIKYNEGNLSYKNKSFIALADLSYLKRDYRSASAYYDSVEVSDPAIEADTSTIISRRKVLARVVELLNSIQREDSLQLLAKLSPAERDAMVKKLVRKYRKEAGFAENEEANAGNAPVSFSGGNQSSDLFGTSSKGEWYFYNNSLKAKGQTEFKGKWGNRENMDNWRRKAAMDAAIKQLSNNLDPDAPAADSNTNQTTGLVPNSYDALIADIPVSSALLDSSNQRIYSALLQLAVIFQNELQDYEEAIGYYEEYLTRLPGLPKDGEAYLGLYYCYNKIGNSRKAQEYKQKLQQSFAGSRYEKAVTDPASLKSEKSNTAEDRKYQSIYDLFIEGKFEDAIRELKAMENANANGYWTPQLLYLQAVYHVKQRQDSMAIALLDQLIADFPNSNLNDKAVRLKDVVSRRNEIESYLNNLQVTRAKEEKVMVSNDKKPEVQRPAAPANAPAQVKPLQPVTRTANMPDTIAAIPGTVAGAFSLQPDAPHMVIMLLNKVDEVYVNEVKNAFFRFNRDNALSRKVTINRDALDPNTSLLLFSGFEDADEALLYFDKAKKSAGNYISWLQPSKYSYLIIDDNNLRVLKANKDLTTYKNLLNGKYGNKF